MESKALIRFSLARALTTAACICLSLAGCGGSDSLTASGGIGGTGVTVGEVSEYGSIFVNGVEFDTRQAAIRVEGAPAGTGDQAAREHLPIGQMVFVSGGFQGFAGTAAEVDSFYRVMGQIQQIEPLDDQTWRLTLLEQTVYVTARTMHPDLSSIQDLSPGTMVKVSGPVDGAGAVHAGFMARVNGAPGGVTAGIKGVVEALDASAGTFRINDLTVSYSQVQPEPASLADGQPVAVEGSFFSGLLAATSVRAFGAEAFDSVEKFSIDGFITEGSGRWRIGGYELDLSRGPLYDGITEDDLGAGIRARIRGRLHNRVLQADRIAVATRVRLESNVATVDPQAGLLTLAGMPSLAVHTNPLTRFFGAELADIHPGDHVRLFGYAGADQTPLAQMVFSPGPASDRFTLQGPVTSANPGDTRFEVLGVPLDSGAPGILFYDAGGEPIGSAEFMSALAQGGIVRVSGRTGESGPLALESMMHIR